MRPWVWIRSTRGSVPLEEQQSPKTHISSFLVSVGFKLYLIPIGAQELTSSCVQVVFKLVYTFLKPSQNFLIAFTVHSSIQKTIFEESILKTVYTVRV